MRREGVIFLIAVIVILLVSTNYYHLFNALALFILAGGIIGTKLSLPDSFMLGGTLLALLIVISWPFRDALYHKAAAYKKMQRFLQTEK
jgi:hypothetical protein